MDIFLQKRADSVKSGEFLFFEGDWFKVSHACNVIDSQGIRDTYFVLEEDVFYNVSSHSIIDIKKFSLKRTLLQL